LKKINMLPPSGSGNVETQIGQWWLSRIGALLFVIGAVLGMTFLTRNTPPWIRFFELTAGSLGITLLGLWLERRVQKFGAVVFGMGLALVYFTAFAAYTVPAVKVLHSPTAGTAAQLAVVAVIVAAALWRNSSATATMAVVLGYVACLFSFFEGLTEYALPAAMVLGVAAAALYLRRGWSTPYLNAIPLSYLILAIIAVGVWVEDGNSPATIWEALAWPMGFMLLYGVADAAAKWRGVLMAHRPRRVAQIVNTTGALLVGWLVAAEVYPDQLGVFYFVFGGVLIAASAAYFMVWQRDVLMHVYFVKGTALVTLGLMTELDSNTRWIALAVESLVLLFSAVRTRLKITEAAMALTWLTSFLFFAYEIIARGYLVERPASPWAFAWTGTSYLLLSAVFLCLQARWLGHRRGLMPPAGDSDTRDAVNLFYAITLGVIGGLVAQVSTAEAHLPLVALGLGLAMAAVSLATRHWIAWLAALLPFAQAHLAFWRMQPGGVVSEEQIWLNGLVLAAVTAALGVAGMLRERESTADEAKAPLRWPGTALAFLWTFTAVLLLTKTLDTGSELLGATLLALGIAVVGLRPRLRGFVVLSALPVLWITAVLLPRVGMLVVTTSLPEAQALELWLAVLVVLLHTCAVVCWEPLRRHLLPEGKRGLWEWVFTVLATLVTLIALRLALDGVALMAALAGSVVVFTALSRWPGLKPGAICAMAFMTVAVLTFLSLSGAREMVAGYLPWSIALALVAVGHAVLIRRIRSGVSREAEQLLEWVQAIVALGVLFIAFYARRESLQTYVTLLWGASAVAMLIVGLATRVQALRLVALAGLALCVGRAFVVDIRETLDRIVAFLALGVGLLAVGFLYTRYGDVIDRLDARDDTAEKHGPPQP
jgi:hypothetical protein